MQRITGDLRVRLRPRRMSPRKEMYWDSGRSARSLRMLDRGTHVAGVMVFHFEVEENAC
jgi:hypothetical protein